MLNNRTAAHNQSPQRESENNPIDPVLAFATPISYSNGSRKRLREFHSGAWWLNVNFVESESNREFAANVD